MSTVTINYDKLIPGLGEVMTSAAVSSVNSEMSTKLDAFMPAPGRATARATAPKKVVPKNYSDNQPPALQMWSIQ